MPAEEQRSDGPALWCARRPDRPLEKGDGGIETSGSGYLREQIRGGRKGRAERQGLGQSPNEGHRLGGIKTSGQCGLNTNFPLMPKMPYGDHL